MSQDAIVMLKDDHKEVRKLFREFQKDSTTPSRKGKLVEKIIELLTVHTYIENVDHHIEEEEQEWFPKVREGLTRTQLREIGAELAEAKTTAPRRPEQPSALKKTIDAVIA